ncbi:Histone deacetylase [Gracilaria domingensis]|nr:Histone deacetylase [Gracilaria domingensis]
MCCVNARLVVARRARASSFLHAQLGPVPTPRVHTVPHAGVCCSANAPFAMSAARRMSVIYSPVFKQHIPDTPVHPECPERLDACTDALKTHDELAPMLDWVDPLEVEPDSDRRARVMKAVRAVHRFEDYLDELQAVCKSGRGLDPDTYVSKQSFEVALLAVSAWMQAVDIAFDTGTAWALARPPGHHATPASGMGFCLLSNAAIAAKYALTKDHITNVAILDYDVHHGNGTEAAVKNEPGIRFASSHQWPLYPGSGEAGVSGKFDNVLNVTLPPSTDIDTYREQFDKMLDFVMEKEPELLIVSAGFDALDVDPLAGLMFRPEDYRLFTELIFERAADKTKVIFGLEGGYNLEEGGLGDAVRESIAGYCLSNAPEQAEL